MSNKFIVLILAFSSLILNSCQPSAADKSEEAKKQIAQTEKDFERMAAAKGIADAFAYYADTSAVMRGDADHVIKGKEGIRNIFTGDKFKQASVQWSADFVDASFSGDLGYTYGKYKWVFKDSTGRTSEAVGIFHTVWKKQKDGSWKFVWD